MKSSENRPIHRHFGRREIVHDHVEHVRQQIRTAQVQGNREIHAYGRGILKN